MHRSLSLLAIFTGDLTFYTLMRQVMLPTIEHGQANRFFPCLLSITEQSKERRRCFLLPNLPLESQAPQC